MQLADLLGFNMRPRLSNIQLYKNVYLILHQHCRARSWFLSKKTEDGIRTPMPWWSLDMVDSGDYVVVEDGKCLFGSTSADHIEYTLDIDYDSSLRIYSSKIAATTDVKSPRPNPPNPVSIPLPSIPSPSPKTEASVDVEHGQNLGEQDEAGDTKLKSQPKSANNKSNKPLKTKIGSGRSDVTGVWSWLERVSPKSWIFFWL